MYVLIVPQNKVWIEFDFVKLMFVEYTHEED